MIEIFCKNTLSQCPSWIRCREFPNENRACKITPRWKRFHFPSVYYIMYFTPVEKLNNWFSPVISCTSPRWVLILPLRYQSDSSWCMLGSHRNHSTPWRLFSWNIGLIFLVMIDCFSFGFTNFFMVSWEP